jgi:hypothetical protein
VTREEAAIVSEYLRAYSEDKVVQFKDAESGEWIEWTFPSFWRAEASYRIKPEPRDIWVNEFGKDGYAVFNSQAEAKQWTGCQANRTAVHYREVIE